MVVESDKNGVAYAVKMIIDLDVAEAKDAIAMPLHESRSCAVLCDFLRRRMRRPVDLNDKFGFATGEVGVVGTDALLPYEFMGDYALDKPRPILALFRDDLR